MNLNKLVKYIKEYYGFQIYYLNKKKWNKFNIFHISTNQPRNFVILRILS